MSEDKLEVLRGSDNPFADAGLPDPDTELMKADLATAMARILRERALSGARAPRSPARPKPTSRASAERPSTASRSTASSRS